MTPDNPSTDNPIYVTAGEDFVGLAKFQRGQLVPLELPSAQRVSLGSPHEGSETVTDLASFSRGFRTLAALDHEIRELGPDEGGAPAAKAFNFCLSLIRTSLSSDLADEILRLCPELPEDGTATLGTVRLAFSQLSSWSDGIGRTINAGFAAQQARINQG